MRKEQPLPKHGACNLGSINLSEFVKNPFTANSFFDVDDFTHAVRTSVEALDTVLDENLNNHALKEQKEMAKNYRNIGLGVMGLHDMLIKLNIKYGDPSSISFVDSLMSLMFKIAVIKSSELAEEKGAFPNYTYDMLSSHIIKNHFTDDELRSLNIDKHGLRNCSLLSIAPTGSLGTMLNVSTGCEPLFALLYTRKTESLNNNQDKYYKVYTGVVKEYINEYGTNLPEYFNTSKDINWKDRINMQAVLQEHIDTAISSTINLPNDILEEEIEQLYLYAWEKGLKGVTIFRDGCKRTGILTTDNKTNTEVKKEVTQSNNNYDSVNEINNFNENNDSTQIPRGVIIKADDNCIGKKRTLHTGCGTLHCEAFFDPSNGNLLETYLSKGSSGGCNNFMIGLSRMISLAARGGVDIYSIVDQLKSSGTCPSYAVRTATKHDTSKGSSCPVAVGNALIDMYEEIINDIYDESSDDTDSDTEIIKPEQSTNKTQKPLENQTKKVNVVIESSKPIETATAKCPQCGGLLVFEGGCNTCKDCGWSKCD